MKFLSRIGLEPFIICLFASIGLAKLAPSVGIAEFCGITLGDAATWGVAGIFFFYGLKLDRQKLAAGLVNAKLHLLVQVSTFVLFPLIVLGAMWLFGAFDAQGDLHWLWLGTFFLASLPSTVSSSVVMVSIAGGNIPAAIFNASISSLLGVFFTPLLMGIFLEGVDGSRGLGDVVLKLVFQVIVPVVAGFALNPKFGHIAAAHKKALRNFDQLTILLIVYTSFCDSYAKDMFAGFPMSDLVVLSLAMVALFVFAMAVVWGVCKLLRFNREDTITAVFCGSKKSLVHGSVMGKVLFDNPAVIGVVLLPTMLYHAYQLIIVSIIAQKLGKTAESEGGKKSEK